MPPARKPLPGNPQWIQWLKEWEREMIEKDSQHLPKAIRKAIKTFESCPVPIEHPANANIMRNVGDKTIAYLTRRMKKYCAENNIPEPIPIYTKDKFEHQAAQINKKKRKSNTLEGDVDDDEPRASTSAAANASDSDREVNTSPLKKPKKTRLYAPRIKSGPWAILIGLASYGTGEWKSQEDIINRADPFFGEEGSSLRDNDAGRGGNAKFFTGWSGHKVLVDKGLVEKKSRNPVLYQITYTGWKIARKAVRNAKRNNDIDFDARRRLVDFDTEEEDTEDDQAEVAEVPPAATAPRSRTAAGVKTSNATAARSAAVASGSASTGQPSRRRASAVSGGPDPNDPTAPFLFSYLGDENHRVKKREHADVDIDNATFTSLFLIEFRQCQSKHIYAKKNIVGEYVPIFRDSTGPEGPTFSAYLPAKCAPDFCPTFDMLKPTVNPTAASVTASTSRSVPMHSPERLVPTRSATQTLTGQEKGKSSLKATSSVSAVPARPSTSYASPKRVKTSREPSLDIIDLDASPEQSSLREKRLKALEARKTQSSSPSKPLDKKGKGRAIPEVQLPNAFEIMQAAAIRASSSSKTHEDAQPRVQMTATADGEYVPDIEELNCTTMLPGTYDIRLVIDTREKPGLQGNKKLEPLLTEKGLLWKEETLNMGDAIWVAKSKITGMEVVLDVCLERKRMDDLLSSMKDGRYMEQKNRMVLSGLSKLIYLVEEYDTKATSESGWAGRVWAMKSSLQIVENFTVHIAYNVSDVCNYLARLTRAFMESYKDTTLYVLPEDSIDKRHHLAFVRHLRSTYPAKSYVTTYQAYQLLNSKQHSVHTVWAKMIASINMMSLASAERFLSRWPSPGEFFEDLDKIEAEDEEAKFRLAEEEALNPNRNNRKKVVDPKVGECWVMRQTVDAFDNDTIRKIGQSLSAHCWKLFTADKY